MKLLFWLYRSSSTEFKIVLITLVVLITLPTFTIVVAAASGASIVGNALALVNPVTRLVELFDTNGNKVGDVELSVNWPVRGVVTDEFGTHEQWRTLLGLGVHSGIDIGVKKGTPITPFMVGNILSVDNIDDSSCGKSVRLKHAHNITSFYCHLDSAVDLAEDTPVKPGDVIGYVGSTGTSTAPHLHFGTQVYGVLVNPRTFMVGEP